MALERVPSDIRKEGGVRHFLYPVIREIMATVTIPVMAKVRIGRFAEAEVLPALEVDFIDESEVLTPSEKRITSGSRFIACRFVLAARAIWATRLRRKREAAAISQPMGEAARETWWKPWRHNCARNRGLDEETATMPTAN